MKYFVTLDLLKFIRFIYILWHMPKGLNFSQFPTSSPQSQRPVDQGTGALDWTWNGAAWGWYVFTGIPVTGACPYGGGASAYFWGALGFDEYMTNVCVVERKKAEREFERVIEMLLLRCGTKVLGLYIGVFLVCESNKLTKCEQYSFYVS